MNNLLKYIIFIWFMVCALIAWVGCALVGFIFVFSDYSWIGYLTPFVGLTIVYALYKPTIEVLKSSPYSFLVNLLKEDKYE